MKNFLKTFLGQNKKTTLAGLLIGVMLILNSFGILTESQLAIMTSFLSLFGFLSSEDAKKVRTLFPSEGQPKEPKKK